MSGITSHPRGKGLSRKGSFAREPIRIKIKSGIKTPGGEELEAEVVLGAAFASDLDALDFEFEFFLAMGPAADDGELVVGDVGRRNALKHVVFDGDLNAGVEGFELALLAGSDAGELGGGLDAVGGKFSPSFFFESAKGGDVCLYAEAVGRG